jgi:hypothetical protein
MKKLTDVVWTIIIMLRVTITYYNKSRIQFFPDICILSIKSAS